MTMGELGDEALLAAAVRCTDTHLQVILADGRVIATPLSWYPRLLAATPQRRAVYEIMPLGIQWPGIDEDLSISGMLMGARAPGAQPPRRA